MTHLKGCLGPAGFANQPVSYQLRLSRHGLSGNCRLSHFHHLLSWMQCTLVPGLQLMMMLYMFLHTT